MAYLTNKDMRRAMGGIGSTVSDFNRFYDIWKNAQPVPIKDDLANPARRALPTDLVKICTPVPPCPIAEAAFPKQMDTDRIWDLIVLAAKSSRYE